MVSCHHDDSLYLPEVLLKGSHLGPNNKNDHNNNNNNVNINNNINNIHDNNININNNINNIQDNNNNNNDIDNNNNNWQNYRWAARVLSHSQLIVCQVLMVAHHRFYQDDDYVP